MANLVIYVSAIYIYNIYTLSQQKHFFFNTEHMSVFPLHPPNSITTQCTLTHSLTHSRMARHGWRILGMRVSFPSALATHLYANKIHSHLFRKHSRGAPGKKTPMHPSHSISDIQLPAKVFFLGQLSHRQVFIC